MTAKLTLDNLRNSISFFIFTKFRVLFKPKVLLNVDRSSLTQVQNFGYLHLKAFYNDDQIQKFCEKINEVFDNEEFWKSKDYELNKGNLKAKTLHNYSSFLDNVRKAPAFNYFSLLFYGRVKKPNIIYTYSTDGSHKRNYVPGKCEKQIAHEPHIDGFRNYLKILILLNDVKSANGPTHIVPGSANDTNMKKYYRLNSIDRTKTQIPLNVLNSVTKNNHVTELTGKKGDVFVINTKNLHWAGTFVSGQREILWLYY
jgi:hypothetical protein